MPVNRRWEAASISPITSTVEGSGLHVEKLSLDIGEVAIVGTVAALYYTRQKQGRGGIWSKLF